jgi:hypothetical protein
VGKKPISSEGAAHDLREWAVFTVDSGRSAPSELNRRVGTSSWASAALQPRLVSCPRNSVPRTPTRPHADTPTQPLGSCGSAALWNLWFAPHLLSL